MIELGLHFKFGASKPTIRGLRYHFSGWPYANLGFDQRVNPIDLRTYTFEMGCILCTHKTVQSTW